LFICERSCAKYIIYFSVAIGEENFLSLASCYVRIFEKGLLFFLLNPESMSGKKSPPKKQHPSSLAIRQQNGILFLRDERTHS
jgi:hypothetical protein